MLTVQTTVVGRSDKTESTIRRLVRKWDMLPLFPVRGERKLRGPNFLMLNMLYLNKIF